MFFWESGLTYLTGVKKYGWVLVNNILKLLKGIRHESGTRMAGLKEEAVESCRRS
jgi:hypothetical protein